MRDISVGKPITLGTLNVRSTHERQDRRPSEKVMHRLNILAFQTRTSKPLFAFFKVEIGPSSLSD